MPILTSEIQEFVSRQKLGFIATVCPDGTPNLSPKGTTRSWDEEHLVFADIHSPQTIKNLLLNPSIEINMVDVFSRKGYRFRGIATVHAEGPVFEAVLGFYRSLGSVYEIHHIVMMKVEQVLPLLSPVYDTGLPEEEVIAQWKAYWDSVYPS
jgi:predicted pyridoxine 5'-phosphate oxidase superfamily flavin-nucleotide-binding protein